jgi:hypothetical protein
MGRSLAVLLRDSFATTHIGDDVFGDDRGLLSRSGGGLGSRSEPDNTRVGSRDQGNDFCGVSDPDTFEEDGGIIPPRGQVDGADFHCRARVLHQAAHQALRAAIARMLPGGSGFWRSRQGNTIGGST